MGNKASKKNKNTLDVFSYDNDNNTKNPYYNNYKLGTKRSIKDYYKFANIDINSYKHKRKHKRTTIIIIAIIT